MTKTDAQRKAEVMFNQLGGLRSLSTMINARQPWFKLEDNGDVMIRFRFSGGKRMNVFTMTLNAMDTYNLKWWYIRGGNMEVVKELNGIYHDQLIEVFERVTGLLITL